MIAVTNPIFGSIPMHPTGNSSRRAHPSNRFSYFNTRQAILITPNGKRRCDLFDMHNELVPYAEAWSWQKSIVEERKLLSGKDEDFSDTLIILQHPPVYTLGTASSEDHLKDVKDFYRTERGGEVTYHGPGQLVIYPILNLHYHNMDLHWYLRALEEVIIRVLSSTFSIKASRHKGLTGVWVGDEKVAAIGVRASKWITYHGIAVNVTADLTPFQRIVPCGIQDHRVGSIKGLLQEEPLSSNECGEVPYADHQLVNITYKSLVKEFCEVFQMKLCNKPIPLLNYSERKPSTLIT